MPRAPPDTAPSAFTPWVTVESEELTRARHGFVEEDTTRDDGRERAWRATSTGWWSDVDPEADPSAVQALDSTIVRVMMASSDEKMLAFADRATSEPEWRDAALFSNSTIVGRARPSSPISPSA